jgi:hypothetical protein
MRSFVIYTVHGGLEWRAMWHKWEGKGMRTGFWWEDLKEEEAGRPGLRWYHNIKIGLN